MRIIITSKGKILIKDVKTSEIDYNPYNSNSTNNALTAFNEISNSINKKNLSNNKSTGRFNTNPNNDSKFLMNIGKNIIASPQSKLNNISTINSNRNNTEMQDIKYIKLHPTKLHMPSNMEMNYEAKDNKATNSIIKQSINDTQTNSSESSFIKLGDVLQRNNKAKAPKTILKKKINGSDSHLIHYLSSQKELSPNYLYKINKSDDNQLFKLDKICQIYFHNQKAGKIMNEIIQKKVKWGYRKEAEDCKKFLSNMNDNLKNSNTLCKNLAEKKNILLMKKVDFLKHHKVGEN